MNDLISRKAAIGAIFGEPLYESGMKKRDADEVVPAIYEKIKALPSAQPERKKGEWIEHENPKDVFSIECSECGCWFLREHLVRNSFCPNCGADMRGEEE